MKVPLAADAAADAGAAKSALNAITAAEHRAPAIRIDLFLSTRRFSTTRPLPIFAPAPLHEHVHLVSDETHVCNGPEKESFPASRPHVRSLKNRIASLSVEAQFNERCGEGAIMHNWQYWAPMSLGSSLGERIG